MKPEIRFSNCTCKKPKKSPNSTQKKTLKSNTTQPQRTKHKKEKKNTHLESPSSRMACSSAVQSREMPGLCFMARAAPEVSGAEDDTCVCSWWFPDGFAIEDKNDNPFPSNASSFKLSTYGLSELTVTSRQLPSHAQHHRPKGKGEEKNPKSKSKPERERSERDSGKIEGRKWKREIRERKQRGVFDWRRNWMKLQRDEREGINFFEKKN